MTSDEEKILKTLNFTGKGVRKMKVKTMKKAGKKEVKTLACMFLLGG
ncbi:MAG: hypothetical protein HY096_15385 [Nitrospinae bacterium]|nr:hypothetical protein [Nitrospinota bacterium]